MKKIEEKRKIPFKNYFILGVICIITVLLTFYVNAWIKTYKANAYSVSPLSGVINEVNINELNEPFLEISEVILYVGYTNNQKLFNEEKELLKKIQNKELSNMVMYLNVTNDKNYIKVLQEKFGDEDKKVLNAPLYIYIKNGKTKEIVNVENKNDLTKDFMDIVKEYKVRDEY